MCQKQMSVSHSSTEFEIISLDAGLRTNGLLALDLWDVVTEVLCSTSSTKTTTKWAPANRCETGNYSRTTSRLKQKENRDVDQLLHGDHVSSNAHSSHGKSQLYIVEDNEAAIKMIIKSRRPRMRHVSRTHRVAIDWLFDRMIFDSRIQLKYVDTKNQLAHIVTKRRFTSDEWNHLLCLLNIMNSSMFFCSHFFHTESRDPCQREDNKVIPEKVRPWRSRNL